MGGICEWHMKKSFIITCLLWGLAPLISAGDASPKYVEKQGYMCYVPEDCFGAFIPANGVSNDHGAYISPVMCAMLDLYNMHIDPKHPNPEDPFDHPLIRDNSRETARNIAVSLIIENKDGAVNDSYRAHGSCSTPLYLAACMGDVELVKLILEKGGDKSMIVGKINQGLSVLQQLDRFSSPIKELLIKP